MNEEQELQAKLIISELLTPNQQLVSWHESHKSKSVYVMLNDDVGKYITFRISHHQSFSGFLTVPTFSIKPIEKFKDNLENYLVKDNWNSFDYIDFFILLLIKYSYNHGAMFMIDDTYATFSNETQAMIFYQYLVRKGQKQLTMNSLSSEMNSVFCKLYANDLIGSYPKENEIQVYITEAGFRLIDCYTDKFIERFIKDYDLVQWHALELPSNK